MQFRFLALSDDGELDSVGEIEATGDFSCVRLTVEEHFENVVATFEVRQVMVLCPGLGDSPGRFVAAEAVYIAHLNGKVKSEHQARSLVWLLEESVPKH